MGWGPVAVAVWAGPGSPLTNGPFSHFCHNMAQLFFRPHLVSDSVCGQPTLCESPITSITCSFMEASFLITCFYDSSKNDSQASSWVA